MAAADGRAIGKPLWWCWGDGGEEVVLVVVVGMMGASHENHCEKNIANLRERWNPPGFMRSLTVSEWGVGVVGMGGSLFYLTITSKSDQ